MKHIDTKKNAAVTNDNIPANTPFTQEELQAFLQAIAEGAAILAELKATNDDAEKMVRDKETRLFKKAYKDGLAFFDQPDLMKHRIDRQKIRMKGGYSADNHFLAILHLYAKDAGVEVSSCQKTRVSQFCKYAHEKGFTFEQACQFVEIKNGMRPAYDVAKDHFDGLTLPDTQAVAEDLTMRFEVMTGTGSKGYLKIDAKTANKFFAKYGIVPKADNDDNGPDGTTPDNDPTPGGQSDEAEESNQTKPEFTAATFFAGAGGADYGLKMAGAKVIYANEFEQGIADLYELNHGMKVDVRSITETRVEDFKKPVIMVGGPPCQSFSALGNQGGGDDERGQLGITYAQRIHEAGPQAFVLENVAPFLMKPDFADVRGLIFDILSQKYNFVGHIFRASDFGVAQDRKRAFIIGYHKSLGLTFDARKMVKASRFTTMQDAIGNLSGKAVFTKGQSLTGNECSAEEPAPYLMEARRVRGWDRCAPTIVASDQSVPLHPEALPESMAGQSGVFFHPQTKTYRRHFTIRECACIQGFPDEFSFGSASMKLAYEVIGNAIPPLMMKAIVDVIKDDLVGLGKIQAPILQSAVNDNLLAQEVANG